MTLTATEFSSSSRMADKPPKWIERDARKVKATSGHPAMEMVSLLHGKSAAAELEELRSMRLDRLKLQKAPVQLKPWLKPSPHDFPHWTSLDMAKELRKFITATRTYSPMTDQLKKNKYLTTTYGPDGLWAGDVITPAGREFLKGGGYE